MTAKPPRSTSAPRTIRSLDAAPTTRFRCGCGRSVAAAAGSAAADAHQCSRCRSRAHRRHDAPLPRTA